MNSSKFLVIGSNSFSGANFVLGALQAGHNVYGISRSDEYHEAFLPYKWSNKLDQKILLKNFKFSKIDLNKDFNDIRELINIYKPEFVVNFAAQGMVSQSWLNPKHWYQTNVVSQVGLHDELRKCKFLKKYVHVTTPEVYGSTNNSWISEDTEFNPSTPYAVSRASCDLHLKSFFQAYDFPVVFTRAANVYGPGQQLYRIIPRTMLSVKTLKKLDLHGGGYSIRGFIHIKDVVNATLKIATQAEPGTTWHISTKDSISIRDLVKKICKLRNVEFENIVNDTKDRLGKDQSYLLDSSALRNNLNWFDEVNLEEGLDDTISWVEKNIELFKNLPWEYTHKV